MGPISSITPIRVRYAETDQMKMVYYGKYLEYFESGRSDLLRSIGLPYPEIEHLGYLLPVVEAHARYFKSARYDDLIEVSTILRERPLAKFGSNTRFARHPRMSFWPRATRFTASSMPRRVSRFARPLPCWKQSTKRSDSRLPAKTHCPHERCLC
jgi:YbgC/YbaW family acyl-CoA thioester hydrolase